MKFDTDRWSKGTESDIWKKYGFPKIWENDPKFAQICGQEAYAECILNLLQIDEEEQDDIDHVTIMRKLNPQHVKTERTRRKRKIAMTKVTVAPVKKNYNKVAIPIPKRRIILVLNLNPNS